MEAELQKRLGEWQRSGVLAAVDKVVASYGLRTLDQFVSSLEPQDAKKVVSALQKQLDARKPPEEAARAALKALTGRDATAFKAVLAAEQKKYVTVLKKLISEFGLQGDGAFWTEFSRKVQERQEQHPGETFEQAARAAAAAFKKG